MRKRLAAIVAFVLIAPTIVWAMGSDYSNEPVHGTDKWPAGLAVLVNTQARVHGYFVNWEDVFFFRGDTAAFNSFLAGYGQMSNTQLRVVIHPGKLEVRSPWDKQPREIVADWKLYASPFSRDQVLASGLKRGPFIRGPFITRVDVWLSGSIKLEELQIPANVQVESGGEIEAFVTKHRDSSRAPAKE